MVIIRCNALIDNRQAHQLITDIHDQAKDGVVVVPSFCEVLAVEDGTDLEIIVGKAESERVAELEAELAAAMEYITAEKNCDACKHIKNVPDTCPCECDKCRHEDCFCRDCIDSSKWEWRGA